ncbi:hypothetical protein RDMS_00945 [Deinococcus sp. RL]|nr:hypothetical protein RDMS_00945 [Deinococcus sp. RL]
MNTYTLQNLSNRRCLIGGSVQKNDSLVKLIDSIHVQRRQNVLVWMIDDVHKLDRIFQPTM